MKVTKALILAAGYATRRLPITKVIAKYMLPIGNRPIIDYVVEDLVKAGITDIYVALNEQGGQVRDYYSKNEKLEQYLKERNKLDALAVVQDLPKVKFHFYDYTEWPKLPLGTAMPVIGFMQKFSLADDEQLLVVGSDDFVYKPSTGSAAKQLIESVAAAGATSGMLTVEVSDDKLGRYGIVEANGQDFVRIIEKPKAKETPSNLANISKYLFDKKLLEATKKAMQNADPILGEALLTDALNYYVADGGRIHVAIANGEYLDGGSTEGWLYANNRVLGDD